MLLNPDFNYVISLEQALDRRHHINSQFSEQNIPFQFFNALSPINTENLLPLLNESETLSVGEKGCFMSHFSLWLHCIEQNLPYISIFEDDIILSKKANEFLIQYDWFEQNFSLDKNFILRFETFLMPVKSEECCDISSIGDTKTVLLKSKHFGTAGYIIPQHTAKYLVELFSQYKTDEFKPIDELIFNELILQNKLNAYQLSPAICVQELQLNKEDSVFKSGLQQERESIRYVPKVKRTILNKIWWELSRPIRKAKAKKAQDIEKNYEKIPFNL